MFVNKKSHFFNISIVGLSAIADFLAVDDDPAITDVHDVISNHGLPLVVVYAVAGNLFVVGLLLLTFMLLPLSILFPVFAGLWYPANNICIS